MRPVRYKTRQRETILAYIASLSGEHVTAVQIADHFKRETISVGRTTVYRHLEALVENGFLRKYTIDGVSGACYQYIRNESDCKEHFHLKCESCGELLHLRCETLDEIQRHILQAHVFQVNPMKTVFYGKCRQCMEEGQSAL